MGLPFAGAVKTYAEFDDVMRGVKAVTGAVGKEFEMLTEKAKFLGRTTSYTSSQIAGAMLELGRAGFAPKEIDDSIAGILDLARATKTDLSETTRIAASALRAFNLPAAEMGRICDVLVAKATEQSEKHLAKIAGKEEKTEGTTRGRPKKEIHADEPKDKDAAVAGLKIHTRLLRDLSTNGGVFV